MNFFKAFFTLLILAITLLSLSLEAQGVEINLFRPVSVKNNWEFGLEQKKDLQPEKWKTIKLPHLWPAQSFPDDRTVNGWYRLRFIIKEQPRMPLSIIPGKINDVDRAYLNNSLIGGNGRFEPRVHAFDKIRFYYLPSELLIISPDGKKYNEILIQVSGVIGKGGITHGPYQIGPYHLLEKGLFFYELDIFTFSIIAFIVSLYFFLFFIMRRKEQANLYFGLFCFFLSFYLVFQTQFKYYLFQQLSVTMTFMEMKRFEYFLLFVMPPLMFIFVIELYEMRKHRIMKYIYDVVVILSIIIVIIQLSVLFYSDNFYDWRWIKRLLNEHFIISMGVFFIGLSFYFAIWRKNKNARILLIGMSLLLCAAVNDIFVNQGKYNAPTLLMYGFGIFMLSIAGILSGRFVHLHNEIEDLGINLAKRVEIQTDELKIALGKISQLKEQQEGDYFLTSLLIDPMQINRNRSEIVLTDFYVSQKKKFQFRKWESELGGDLCVTGNISLFKRNYVAFINGDAMGKSMQGAGGALIMGVLFNAALERSRLDRDSDNIYPEKWLYNVYIELQRLFVAFNGSMYVSAVIGLVDEGNGFLYYFNAEHPRMVVYNDGTVEFLEEAEITENSYLRKIGTPGEEYKFQVKTYQIRQGDIIITGSDGRDDIEIDPGPDAKGRIINDNENLFLDHVRRSGGNLTALVQKINASGELIDDLTLLRVSYREDEMEADTGLNEEDASRADRALDIARSGQLMEGIRSYEELHDAHPFNEAIAQNLSVLYTKNNDFPNTARMFDISSSVNPGNLEYIYQSALAYYRMKEYSRSIETTERIILRNPGHLEGLLLLAELKRLHGSFSEAKKYIDLARYIAGDEPRIKKLEKLLGSRE